MAAHVATVGRLPLLGTVDRVGPPAPSDVNSAQRVRSLYDGFAVPPALASTVADLDGPLLLVDDLVDSGWTMALVARELRRAGADAVLPLALAVTA